MVTERYCKPNPLQRSPSPRRNLLYALIFFLLLNPQPLFSADPGKPDAREKKSLHQTELDLAKRGTVYTLLDLSSRQLTLKIKGLPLKVFHLADVSSAKEKSLPGSAHRLVKKYPPPPTIEKEIPPAGASEKPISPLLSTETVFISVGNMPSRYRLYFEDGFMISIASEMQECSCGRIEKGLRLLKETAAKMSWEAGRWVADRRFPDLRLILSEEEAKALFWSLSEGSWLLIDSE